jgi:hypothetical protein
MGHDLLAFFHKPGNAAQYANPICSLEAKHSVRSAPSPGASSLTLVACVAGANPIQGRLFRFQPFQHTWFENVLVDDGWLFQSNELRTRLLRRFSNSFT